MSIYGFLIVIPCGIINESNLLFLHLGSLIQQTALGVLTAFFVLKELLKFVYK